MLFHFDNVNDTADLLLSESPTFKEKHSEKGEAVTWLKNRAAEIFKAEYIAEGSRPFSSDRFHNVWKNVGLTFGDPGERHSFVGEDCGVAGGIPGLDLVEVNMWVSPPLR